MSNDEVETVMENFMNKLFVSPNLLEDENLNYRIEKIFENQVFQKMVENANVLEDAGVISDSQNKGDPNSKKRHKKEKSEDFDPNGDFLDKKAIEKSELEVKQEDILPVEDEQLHKKPTAEELQANAIAHDRSKSIKLPNFDREGDGKKRQQKKPSENRQEKLG